MNANTTQIPKEDIDRVCDKYLESYDTAYKAIEDFLIVQKELVALHNKVKKTANHLPNLL